MGHFYVHSLLGMSRMNAKGIHGGSHFKSLRFQSSFPVYIFSWWGIVSAMGWSLGYAPVGRNASSIQFHLSICVGSCKPATFTDRIPSGLCTISAVPRLGVGMAVAVGLPSLVKLSQILVSNHIPACLSLYLLG